MSRLGVVLLIRTVPVVCDVCVMCGSTNTIVELSSFRSGQHSGSDNMSVCVLAFMLVHV